MRLRSLHPLVLLVALAWAGAPAAAAPPAVVVGARAEEYVAAANRAFRAGDYDRALAELEVGYAVEPRREFLITFAQVYAAMGRLDDAIDRCERYLAVAPSSALAGQVRQLVRGWRRLKDEQRQQDEQRRENEPPVRVVVPIDPPPPAAANVSAERAPVTLAAAPATERSAAPGPSSSRDHRRRRVTWMLIGGAAVVVVGVSLGVGLGLGLRDDTPATKLGTVAFH